MAPLLHTISPLYGWSHLKFDILRNEPFSKKFCRLKYLKKTILNFSSTVFFNVFAQLQFELWNVLTLIDDLNPQSQKKGLDKDKKGESLRKKVNSSYN